MRVRAQTIDFSQALARDTKGLTEVGTLNACCGRTLCSGISLNNEQNTGTTRFHKERVEGDPAIAYSGAGSAVAEPDAL